MAPADAGSTSPSRGDDHDRALVNRGDRWCVRNSVMLQGLPEARNAMRSGAACGLALVVLCGASVPLFAQEDDAESAGQAAAEVAPGDYQQALAPYGAWVDDGSYGHVWQPAVGEEWQPYVDGSWAWTGDGWTWESDEPWGWTLHYTGAGRCRPSSAGCGFRGTSGDRRGWTGSRVMGSSAGLPCPRSAESWSATSSSSRQRTSPSPI